MAKEDLSSEALANEDLSSEALAKEDPMVELEREISQALERADEEIAASRVEQLEVALAAEREQNLRLRADFENYRKRTAREKQELAKRVRGDLIARLLPVLDNFERAVEAAVNSEQRAASNSANGAGGPQPTVGAQGLAPLLEGIRMVYEQLKALLAEWDVTPIESLGQMFDPSVHEAVGTRVSEDLPEGCVVEEHERGYRFGDEILRPAKVTIAVGS